MKQYKLPQNKHQAEASFEGASETLSSNYLKIHHT